MKRISEIKFRKILNDLKRRPEDAASDLGVSKKKIDKILEGKKSIDFELIQKAVEVWPVNYNDFFHISDDTKNDYKICKNVQSNTSERVMYRGGKPYYSYKDTVMSKVSAFRPEWIKQLVVVNNSNPNNKKVKFNNGHFLHQFTYFIGPVNFYYMESNKKKVAEMNTGDSMYISPYVPHTFTTRKNSSNKLGFILALTYTDKIDSESLNELTAIGYNLAKKYQLNLNNELNAFKSNLEYQMKVASITKDNLRETLGFGFNDLCKRNKIPDIETIKKVSNLLNINVRDLLPPTQDYQVKIMKYKENKSWYYPSKKNKKYNFVELTNLPQLPTSKGFELEILTEKENEVFLDVPSHQYIYNIGNSKCIIKFHNKKYENFEPGDSIYLKPNLKHKFIKKGKILVLRIGGRISGDILYQLSMINKKNFKRVVQDNKSWFD